MLASLFTRRTARLLPPVRVLLITFFAFSLFSFDGPNGSRTPRGSAQTVAPLVGVSAASFQANRPVAPNSIVALFTSGILPQGTFTVAADAIPGTTAIDLPTLLGNFSVEIHGRSAGIFAMVNTPGYDQLNVLVPPDLEPGRGPIVVKNAAGQIVAAGEIEVGTVTPAIFTANSSGTGVPAALIYRFRNGVFLGAEDVLQFNQQTGSFVPRPIDLGPPEDELFLILFLTGIRKVANANATRVLIGGEELIPLFAGDQGSFSGLDQVNLKLSRTLRGRLTLAFTAIGYGTSNLCEIEIAPPSNAPPSVNALSSAESLAGDLVEISGTGFSSDSEVVISDVNKKLFNAKIMEARSTSLRVLVPYGAGTGNVVVRNSRGEASFPFKMRTSLSGIVQVAQKQQDGSVLRVGAPQVTIKLVGFNLPPIQTNSDGSFLMPDVPPTNPLSSGLVFEVDGTSNPVLGLAKEKRRIRVVSANRDNPFPEYIELKRESNESVPTIAGNLPTGQFAVAAQANPRESEVVGQTGQVVFEPNGSSVQLDGQPVARLKVTVLDTGRTPADLPFGQFSSTIVQLSPLGARLQPGGKLTFPNTDGLPANKAVTLYRFDQTANSNTIGQFVTAGLATVTADGQKIETAPNAVIESTYYFVSDTYPTTTIYGRVVEEDDSPARGALVQVSGQSIFSLTDDNGTFFLVNVPVVGAIPLSVEVSFLRPDGTVDRAERTGLQPGAGGLTYVSPPIKLPGQGLSRAPLILAPKNLSIEAGKTSDFSFLAYARVAGLTLQPISVTGAPFASVLSLGNDRYTLRLNPGSGAAGNYTLMLSATDSQNQTGTSTVDLEVKAPAGNAPVAIGQSTVTTEDTPVNIALTGTGGTIFRIINQPLRGRLEGTAPNVLYRPDPDFNGPDTFSFAVSNGTVESAPAVVSVAVQPVPDQPQLDVGSAFSTNIGQKLTFVITGREADGQTLTLNSTGLPSEATIKQTTATSWLFEWTPTAAQIGSYTLNLTLVDNGSPVQSAAGSVAITVDAKWARSPGIDGGLIQCFLVNGSTIFAGTDFGGIFRSTDNGASWAPSGLSNSDVISLLSTGGAIFAGTGRGVYRSTDNGASWTEVSNGLPTLPSGEYRAILSLAVAGNSIFAGTTAGVYRTADNGANWTIASNGLPNKPNEAVLINVLSLFLNGGSLFAGTSDGVYRTTDNGANWTAAKTGLPGGSVVAIVANGSTLFCSAFGNGIYRSTNGGANWTAVNNGLTEPFIRSLLFIGNVLLAGSDSSGAFGSTDNGNTWNERGLAQTTIYALASAPGGTVIAGTYNSIYRTADGGANWTRISSGLSNLWVYSVVVGGSSIFTGTDDGVYRTTDNGSSWVRAGLKDQVVSTVAIAGSSIIASSGGLTYRSADNGASWTDISEFFDFGQVYEVVAVGNTHLATSDAGLFRSTDGGANWASFGAGLPMSSGLQGPLDGLAVNGQFVFAGTVASGVYRSSDGGANWTAANTGLPQTGGEYDPVNFLSAGSNVVFAGYGGVLFRSTDNGANWMAANIGLQGAFVRAVSFSGNAFHAATSEKGVFRSTDNGATWSPSGLTNFLHVFSIVGNGTTLFAGTSEGAFVLAEAALAWAESNNGLANRFVNAAIYDVSSFILGTNDGGAYRSTDDGKNWQPANNGLPPAATIRALVKTAGGTFAGIPGSGVYLSADQGQTWAARNNGLTNNQVNALAADGTTLLAGTEGGVFRSTDGGASWTAINNGLTRLRVLALTASAAGILAGTDSGLFRFTTASSTWSTANTGLTDQYIVSLGFAPNGTNLLTGTSSGLFLSTNGGQNWTRVDRGISERAVVLNLLAAGNKLLAGTVNGFYISDDNGTSWGVNNTGLINPQVSALAFKGSLVVAGTRNSGVFLSQIPDVIANHPPAVAFSCSTSLTTTVGGSVSCTVTRSDPDAGQTTSLSAGGILEGAQFNPATGAFSWTPQASQAGVHFVTFTATDNGNPRLASSRDLMVTINSPVPQLSSLTPSSRPAGTTDFLLVVNGTGFVEGSRIRWNGSNRTTAFLGPTQVATNISAADVATPGSASITVSNPTPGGGISNSLTFTISALCNFAINPTSRAINAAGGTGSVAITTGANCPWETVSNDSWLMVTSASAGTGNATVNYSVQPNTVPLGRLGSITIAGQNFTVSQGAGTEIAVDDGSFEQTLGVGGGGTVGAVNRLTPGTYPATLYGISIAIPANQGVTNGEAFTLLYGSISSTEPNINTVNLQTLGATAQSVGNFFVYTIPELTINSGDFLVGYRITHPANEWPVNNDRSSGSRRRSYYQSNNGQFSLIDAFDGFAGNFGIRARTSAACSPNIGATSQQFGAPGGTGSVSVSNATGCNWSAFSTAPWITITSGATGSGNTNVSYSVLINLTTAQRTGIMTIAGRDFTVTQAAGQSELTLDDGEADQEFGVSGGGTLSVVNRFTPPIYPLTITGIRIFIPTAIAAGKAMTLLVGTVPSNAENLNGVSLGELNTTVQAPGAFHTYTLPNQIVNSGDIVLGFRMQHSATEAPVANDQDAPLNKRSYYASGGNFVPIGSFAGFDGNFLIRAPVNPPAAFGEEAGQPLVAAAPQGLVAREVREVPKFQPQPVTELRKASRSSIVTAETLRTQTTQRAQNEQRARAQRRCPPRRPCSADARPGSARADP